MTAVVVGAVLAFPGCGGDNAEEVQPKTVVVDVDGRSPDVPASFHTYFPNEVKVRPGDTVTFRGIFTGEPHTVAMGTRIDAALSELTGPDDQPRPALDALSRLRPAAGGDLKPAALNPCFVDAGDLPQGSRPCPERPQPVFTGRQAFYSRGFLPEGSEFKVKLSDDITPGAYGFTCLLHDAMIGQVIVADEPDPVPSPSEVAKAGEASLAALTADLKAALAKVAAEEPESTLAGVGSSETPVSQANLFVPERTEIAPGGSVTWAVRGRHTISIGAPPDAMPFINMGASGNWEANPKAVQPLGAAVGQFRPPEPPAAPGSGGEPAPVSLIDAGSWDGTGAYSSGVLSSPVSAPMAYKLTFPQPGGYNYRCLIHPEMTGHLIVR